MQCTSPQADLVHFLDLVRFELVQCARPQADLVHFLGLVHFELAQFAKPQADLVHFELVQCNRPGAVLGSRCMFCGRV